MTDRNNPKETPEVEESTVKPIHLSDLKGAVLTWTDPAGNERRVKFNE